MNGLNRRSFLQTTAGAALAHAAFSQNTPAQTSSSLSATKLADDFLLISGAGSNVVAVIGAEEVLLVDGGDAAHSPELLKFVSAQAGGKPVKVAFNTHWHHDHIGSNEALGKSGAKIYSHAFTKQWLSTEIDWGWQHQTFEPLPEIARPNQTFYDSGKLTFGKETVEYAHIGPAHTDGDIYVYFPGPNILVAGDVVSANSYPVLDWTTGGWIYGLVNAQDALLKLVNAETRIVPGTGPVQTQADLQALRDMCETVRGRLFELIRHGNGPQDMVAAKPTKEFDQKYGDPELFILNAYRGLWAHVRELPRSGIV